MFNEWFAEVLMLAMAQVLAVVLLFLYSELYAERFHDQTASYEALPDIAGIISFNISAEFREPRLTQLNKYCQGTLVSKTMRDRHDCEYVVVTAAHCIRNPVSISGLQYEPVSPKVSIRRAPFLKSVWSETHPHWAINSEEGMEFGNDIGFVRFSGSCSLKASVVPMWTGPFQQNERMFLASVNHKELLPGKIGSYRHRDRIIQREDAPRAIMHGDSGGGCFIKRDNQYYLTGVISFSDPEKFGMRSYCTTLDALRWLKRMALSD